MRFSDAVEFLITNYDELSSKIDITQEIGFIDDSDKLHIKTYSSELEKNLRSFFGSKNKSLSVHVIQLDKKDSKLLYNLDAWLLLYAPAIPNQEKTIKFITKLSRKYKSLSSIAITEPKDDRNVLMQAIYYDRLDTVKLLMEQDSTLYETRDRLGNNPLLSASTYGRIYIIQYLLDQCKKTPFVESENGKLNPLFCAIYGKKEEMVKYWLNNYPMLYYHVNKLGESPIIFAREHSNYNITKYLEEGVVEPTPSLEKVCDSSYSWQDCERVYFSSDNNSFRDYYVANIKDKWGRNAVNILMSSIAIILSPPQLVFDEKSKAYRNTIDMVANQLKKRKLFIDHKVKVDELDDNGRHAITTFLLALSKQSNEMPFGWDPKLQQDKGAL